MRARTFQLAKTLLFLAIVTASLNNTNGQQTTADPIQIDEEETIKLTARYHVEKGTQNGFVIVKVVIPQGSYIYGISQPSPLIPSKFAFKADQSVKQSGAFKPDKKPKVIEKDPIFETRLEKHFGTVQFYAPIKIAADTKLEEFKPTLYFSGQICSDKGYCEPINRKMVKAGFSGFFEREAKKPVFEKLKK